MEKRGQAAMEFLMTYGWAILAAIIAIAVLAYFGVFNPGRYTSEMCQVSAPFTCDDDSVVSATTGVDIIVRNGGDEDFIVTGIEVQNCNDGGTTLAAPITVGSGDTETITAVCATTLTEGTSFRGNIAITYTKATGGRVLTATGSITRKDIIA